MKRLVFILILLTSHVAFSQSLSFFRINSSNFPKLSANFYAFGKDGRQIIDLSIPDFNLNENEIERKITLISCPTPKPAEPISAVLTLDVSGSMIGKNIEMAKTAAVAWVDALPQDGKTEVAITSFTQHNSLHQDFTKDKQKLRDAILSLRAGGGTDFNAGFINEPAGALLVAKNGRYKKVVVFLTDGSASGNESQIIQTANNIGAIVYCVTLGFQCPEILRNICEKTGGMYFENVTSEDQAKAVYMQIMTIAQSLEPCTIEWESADDCNAFRNVELLLKTTNTNAKATYTAPTERIPKIEYEPSMSLKFGNVEPPLSETKEITLVAKNKNIWINGITISNSDFQIADWGGSAPPFILMKDNSRKIKVKYTPSKSGYAFCKFDVDNSACFGKTFFAVAGVFNPQTEIGTLRLTFPNGGETFVAGEDSIITWEGVLPEDTVSLDYSTDKGASWFSITNKASDLKFNWNKIPNTPSNECLMKVTKGEEYDQKAGEMIKVLGFSTSPKFVLSPISNELALLHSSLITKIDFNTKKILRTFAYDFTYGIYCLDYSPQGDRIAIGGGNGTLKLIDAKTGELLKSFDIGKKTISLVKFNAYGNYLACSSGDSIYIFDVNSSALIGGLYGHRYGIYDMLFSPNGDYFISSGNSDSLLKIWDANSFRLIDTIFTSIYGDRVIAISPDGRKLAYIYGSKIKMINISTKEEIQSFYGLTEAYFIEFSPLGDMIAAYMKDKTIKVWDVKSGAQINEFFGIKNADGNLKFSHDGKKLISTGGRELKIWDLKNQKAIDSLQGHGNTINKVSLSPDNNMIASTGDDGSIIIWDINTGWVKRIIDGKSKWIQCVVFTNDNKYVIASSNGDTVIRVFDVATGNEVRKFSGHTAAVSSIKLSAAGDKLVSGGYDNTIKIWDYKNGTMLQNIWGFNSGVASVDFNPEGTKVASGTNDNRIIIWDVASGTEIATFFGHQGKVNSVAFSPDGTMLASGSDDGLVKVWTINDGQCIFSSKFGHRNDVKSVVFSPDNYQVLSGGLDGNLFLWDITTSSISRTFTAKIGAISSVAISGDGNRAFAGGEGRTVGIWAINDLTENNMQFDDSDSLWSIVAPKVLALDVDMGKVFAGSMKDSTVEDFIKNNGTWKFKVDTVFIRGNDAPAFSVVGGNFGYTLEPTKSHEAVFRFSPQEAREYIADIVIATQNDTLIQKIKGIGVQQQLKILADIIDFGKVYLNHYKDTIVTAIVENVGQQKIDITGVESAGPDRKQFSILKGGDAFSLNPGEKHQMELRFTAKEFGRTSGSIAFHHSNFGSPAIAQLFANAYKITPQITSNSPICIGHDLLLYADSIPNVKYHWSGPNNFISNERCVIIKRCGLENAGLYQLYTSLTDPTIKPTGEINTDTASILVEINIDKVFPGDSSLIYVGNASREEDYLKLTESKPWDAGSVWLKNRFSVKQDFSTTFKFQVKYGDNRLANEGSIPGADGFSFVFQNHSYPALGNKGEAMGYEGISNSLAIEFDLFQNLYDPNGNHIAVQSEGAFPNTPDHRIFNSVLGMNKNIPIIRQDTMYYVMVSYQNSTKELNIYLDTNMNFKNPILTVDNLDMAKYLKLEDDEYVYIGFTAATGKACQEHRIYNWEVPCNNLFVDVKDGNIRQVMNNEYLSIYPNPAGDFLNVEYSIANPCEVTIEVFDILGNKIQIIDYGFVDSGHHHVIFSLSKNEENGIRNLRDGIYYLVLRTNDGFLHEKFGVMR